MKNNGDVMETTDELKKIKKLYGEEMMHLCRTLFPTILESEGVLLNILTTVIYPTKHLAQDIIENCHECEFKNFIYSYFIDNKTNNEENKDPKKLLKSVGYTLYKCRTQKQILKFKKYYVKGERLCTFGDNRLKKCYVFFAVRDDAEKLNRNDFKNPKREDAYGTSVISIQFSRGENNTLSIKNRYNHKVSNPDATFGNNLDNIVLGLTEAFRKKYKLNIDGIDLKRSNFLTSQLNYVMVDGKYYRYNLKVDNIYYCENNIIIDHGKLIDKYSKEKERYILMDCYILDLKEKVIKNYDKYLSTSFCDTVNIGIKKIKVEKCDKNKIIIVCLEDNKNIYIVIDEYNNIIEYRNNNVTKIGDFFLYNNKTLLRVDLENVKSVGNNFLAWNQNLRYINISNLERAGRCFLHENRLLEEINLPKLTIIESSFLDMNRRLNKINIPNVKIIGEFFLHKNEQLRRLYLQSVERIYTGFLSTNKVIDEIIMPNVTEIGDLFLLGNRNLKVLDLPKLKNVGSDFLYYNEKICYANLKSLIKVDNDFMYSNKELKELFIFK